MEELSLRLTFGRAELDHVLAPENYSPESLIALFRNGVVPVEGSGDLHLYDRSVHVGALTLWQHSLGVLRRFEEYFAHRPIPGGVDINFFRVVLVLHDAGKPMGGIYGQHEHTAGIVNEILTCLGYSEEEVRLALALLSKDPIGFYLRREPDYEYVEDVMKDIQSMACDSGLSFEDFFEFLLMYYTVDASSYAHLRHLFVFRPDERRMEYAEGVERVIVSFREVLQEVLDERLVL